MFCSEENLSQTTVVLCASMQTPWHILPQLQKWANILEVSGVLLYLIVYRPNLDSNPGDIPDCGSRFDSKLWFKIIFLLQDHLASLNIPSEVLAASKANLIGRLPPNHIRYRYRYFLLQGCGSAFIFCGSGSSLTKFVTNYRYFMKCWNREKKLLKSYNNWVFHI